MRWPQLAKVFRDRMGTLINRRVGVSALFAVLWSVLALNSPTTTFHLAPLIVAAWPALSERSRPEAIRLSVAGLLIAVATTAILFFAGLLEGPSLLPWGDAGVESLVAAVTGAVLALIPALVSTATQQT